MKMLYNENIFQIKADSADVEISISKGEGYAFIAVYDKTSGYASRMRSAIKQIAKAYGAETEVIQLKQKV